MKKIKPVLWLRTWRGSLWMLAAGACFAGMAVFIKLASKNFSAPELVFYRAVLGVLLTAGLSYGASGDWRTLATIHGPAHLARGLIGFIGMISLFQAIALLPVATAMTLNYTSPLFLTVMTALFLGERLGWQGVCAIVAGFVGVILLLHPSFATNQLMGLSIGLASGIVAGAAYFWTRQLGKLGEPSVRVVFYFALIGSVCAGIWVSLTGGFHAMNGLDIVWIISLGLCGTAGQISMTRAYSRSSSVAVSGLSYSTVLFTCLLGALLWGEVLDLEEWLAVLLIIGGGLWAARSAQEKEI